MNKRIGTEANTPLPVHASLEASEAGNGGSAVLPPDALRQLKVELDGKCREQPADMRLNEETRRLLDETWSLFIECLVMRDGLLEACGEIERTMRDTQRQLGALPVAVEPDGQERLARAIPTAANGSNGAAGANGSNGAAANGSNGVAAH